MIAAIGDPVTANDIDVLVFIRAIRVIRGFNSSSARPDRSKTR